MGTMEITSEECRLFRAERDDYTALLSGIGDHRHAATAPGLEITGIGNSGGAASVVEGRPCGGFLLRYGGRTMIVDPGDNSVSNLVRRGFDPFGLTDVLVSHAHNDHAGDLALAVSGAINLGLSGSADSRIVVSPSLVDYSRGHATRLGFTLPEFGWKAQVHSLFFEERTGTRFDGMPVRSVPEVDLPGGIRVRATEARHDDTAVTGFVLETAAGRIGYTSDTEYFDGLKDWFRDVDLLWMNMNTLSLDAMLPRKAAPCRTALPIHNHLGYVGVCRLIDEVRPRMAIVSHFGAQLLHRRAAVQSLLRKRFAGTGTEVYCAENWDRWHFDGALSDGPTRRSVLQ